MGEYEVFRFENESNETVIFINSTEDLYYLQDDIYEDLSRTAGQNFKVLVDLFLRNGFSFNRFISLHYEGKDKCQSFIVNPREVSEEVKVRIRNYLRKNMELLNNSALTKSAITFVTAGKS